MLCAPSSIVKILATISYTMDLLITIITRDMMAKWMVVLVLKVHRKCIARLFIYSLLS